MGIKIRKLLLLSFIMLSFSVLFCAEVFANEIIRVGLTDNKFQNVLRQEVIIYGTAECDLCDKFTKQVIAHIPADTDIKVINSVSGLYVEIKDKATTLRDFVVVCPTGLLGVRDLKRKGQQALYHGAFEIAQEPQHKGLYLINLVEIQEYLKGVVPNEMPVRFGVEALKAQAVAARNYVLSPRVHAYQEFDVVDSVSSQVYFGANTESDAATRAVMETNGIVALHNNDLILALYSSTAGGYTESYEYAFSEPETKAFPAIKRHYLTAVPDRVDFPALDSEERAYEFYTSKIPSYDIESPYYRWEKEWAVGELENVLKKTLIAQSKTGFVFPVFKEGDDLGTLKDIKVMKRGVSGKIIELEILTTKECYRISKELVIRRVFQKDEISLPSANVIFEKKLDKEGNITDIIAHGGGFGHGVGMSQYGAGFMATKLNQPYYNILRHYYKGISLGTRPLIVKNADVEQRFWSPIGRASVVIVGQVVPKIDLTINGKKQTFLINKHLFKQDVKIDISGYIEDGENIVVFHPAECPLKMYIEVVEKFNEPTIGIIE